MSISSSTALIPYVKPMTPIEFIQSEVERELANRASSGSSIEQQPCSIHLPLVSLDLINLNLTLSYIFERFRISSSESRNPENPSLSRPIGMSKGTWKLGMDFDFGDVYFPRHSAAAQGSSVSSRTRNMLNGEEIAETLQAEASFTIATDKKPIVATYGCGPCVALGGYDQTNKIAFVVHFSLAGEVRASGGFIFYNIAKLVKEKITSPIQLHLRGGIEGQSEALIEAIKIWMMQRKDLPMEIASEDILDSGMSGGGKSLAIDSRTGAVSEYDPMNNPKSRGISDLDAMSALMSAFEPRIRLAYRPQ